MHYTLFDTAMGRLGMAWRAQDNPDGQIWAVQLPDVSDTRTAARLLRDRDAAQGAALEQTAAALPPPVRRAVEGVQALLAGERDSLSWIALELDRVPAFHRQVYEVARRIPPGQTRTYGELARELGDPAAARAVGQALGANPFAPVVPCHRILAASGQPGGFSATGGVRTKLRLLEIERACFGGQEGLF